VRHVMREIKAILDVRGVGVCELRVMVSSRCVAAHHNHTHPSRSLLPLLPEAQTPRRQRWCCTSAFMASCWPKCVAHL